MFLPGKELSFTESWGWYDCGERGGGVYLLGCWKTGTDGLWHGDLHPGRGGKTLLGTTDSMGSNPGSAQSGPAVQDLAE